MEGPHHVGAAHPLGRGGDDDRLIERAAEANGLLALRAVEGEQHVIGLGEAIGLIVLVQAVLVPVLPVDRVPRLVQLRPEHRAGVEVEGAIVMAGPEVGDDLLVCSPHGAGELQLARVLLPHVAEADGDTPVLLRDIQPACGLPALHEQIAVPGAEGEVVRGVLDQVGRLACLARGAVFQAERGLGCPVQAQRQRQRDVPQPHLVGVKGDDKGVLDADVAVSGIGMVSSDVPAEPGPGSGRVPALGLDDGMKGARLLDGHGVVGIRVQRIGNAPIIHHEGRVGRARADDGIARTGPCPLDGPGCVVGDPEPEGAGPDLHVLAIILHADALPDLDSSHLGAIFQSVLPLGPHLGVHEKPLDIAVGALPCCRAADRGGNLLAVLQ